MAPTDYYWQGNGNVNVNGTRYGKGSILPAGVLTETQITRFLKRKWITPAHDGASGGKVIAPPKPKPEAKPEQDKSSKRWAFTAEELNGKMLSELNMMIADRAEKNGENQPPIFETLEEAAAFMMRDV